MRWCWMAVAVSCTPEIAPTLPAIPDCDTTFDCESGLCWVTICGGAYAMGAEMGIGEEDEHPRRLVLVPTFELLQTEVTVGQYLDCVDDGACHDRHLDALPGFCLDNPPDAPQGCLDWHHAQDVCAWAGGRLPSEAEWEFAARSRGDRRYPWGGAPPTCDLAVLGYVIGDPCGESGPAPVCSRPAGTSDQGLCDMAGNIYEWVEDYYHVDYVGGPSDAAPWIDDPVGDLRVLRGGGINSEESVSTTNRTLHDEEFWYSGSGVRCAR